MKVSVRCKKPVKHFRNMGRNKILAKNISFVLIGNVGSKLMGFIMLPLYTSWLSPADYGVTDIMGVYAGLLLNVVACDVSDAIFVFPSGATEVEIKKYYSSGFFFQIFCSLLCAFAFFLLTFIGAKNSFFEYIWYVYGILISNLFQKYAQDFCRGINKMSVFSFTGIVQSASIALFSILLIPHTGVYGFATAMIIANTITGIFTFFYSRSYRFLSVFMFDWTCLKRMLKYSIPLIPTAIMWWLVSSLNRPLLERHIGMFAIGLFAVANKLPNVLNMVFGLFQQAWNITAIEEFAKKDFSLYYNKMFRVVFGMQTFLCMVLVLFSKLFVMLFTSAEYMEAWKYVPLLCLSVLFSNTSAFVGSVFTAIRKSNYIFISTIFGGVGAIVFNYLLIPQYGLLGACVAIILSHLLSMVSRIFFSAGFVEFKAKAVIVYNILIIMLLYFVSLMEKGWILGFTFAIGLVVFVSVNHDTYSILILKLKNTVGRHINK